MKSYVGCSELKFAILKCTIIQNTWNIYLKLKTVVSFFIPNEWFFIIIKKYEKLSMLSCVKSWYLGLLQATFKVENKIKWNNAKNNKFFFFIYNLFVLI